MLSLPQPLVIVEVAMTSRKCQSQIVFRKVLSCFVSSGMDGLADWLLSCFRSTRGFCLESLAASSTSVRFCFFVCIDAQSPLASAMRVAAS